MNRLLFFIVDFIAFIETVIVTTFLIQGELNYPFIYHNAEILIPLFFIFCLVLWIFSFYDLYSLRRRGIEDKNIFISFLISFFIALFFFYFAKHYFDITIQKNVVFLFFALYFFYIYISRKVYAISTFHKQNIIIFGTSKTLEELLDELSSSHRYNIISHYKTLDGKTTYPIKNIDFILIANNILNEDGNALNIINYFLQKNIPIKIDFALYEDIFSKISDEGMGNNLWFIFGIMTQKRDKNYLYMKRIIDILFSTFLFFIFLPVMALIYILIYLIDGINPIFRQERVGWLNKKIYIYKFRTIHPTLEQVTKLGSFLRRFRLDETPQFINILRGDISIVGPRPLYVEDYNFLCQHIRNHTTRNIVQSGLTGWAQLNYKAPPNSCHKDIKPSNLSEILKAANTRMSYDIWYIKNHSLLLDLEIILKTTKRIFLKDNKVK